MVWYMLGHSTHWTSNLVGRPCRSLSMLPLNTQMDIACIAVDAMYTYPALKHVQRFFSPDSLMLTGLAMD